MARKRYKPEQIVAKLRSGVSAPVRRSGSIARHNAWSRAVLTTSSVSRPILSSFPGTTGAMAIERLRQAGWIINDNRVERIWRPEGLRVLLGNPGAANLAGGRIEHPAAAAASQSCLVL
jgi:hypothetical protein